MAEFQEVWESSFGGTTSYGAYGPRDVLIIVSKELIDKEEVIQRREGKLTQEDKGRLSSEGIPRECWSDDAKLMETRYVKSPQFHSVAVEDSPHMKKEHVLSRIVALFNITNKPGDITYIGPGRRHTGDWCFTDGFISFTDITDLYTRHFKGRALTICCDCSYSGRWVEACKDFLDSLKVQPCGHSARSSGIMLKVYTSCLPHQVASSLLYFSRGCGNDKNNGALFLRADSEIGFGQTTSGVDFTRVTCGGSMSDACKLSPNFSFAKQKEVEHIYLICWRSKGRRIWQYVLLMEDPEIIDVFEQKLRKRYRRSETVDVKDFGVVLKSGFGNEPPQEAKEWLRKILMGLEVL